MFNRITTLALAAISTQAVKLLSQVDAEADQGLWVPGIGRFSQTDAEAEQGLWVPGIGRFSQVDAEADAELGFGGAAFGVCLFNPNPPPECGHGLAQVEAEADMAPHTHHALMHMYCLKFPDVP